MPSKLEFVHVIEHATGKSIHVVGPTTNAEKTERGMDINLDHTKYFTKVTTCGHPMADPEACLLCAL